MAWTLEWEFEISENKNSSTQCSGNCQGIKDNKTFPGVSDLRLYSVLLQLTHTPQHATAFLSAEFRLRIIFYTIELEVAQEAEPALLQFQQLTLNRKFFSNKNQSRYQRLWVAHLQLHFLALSRHLSRMNSVTPLGG